MDKLSEKIPKSIRSLFSSRSFSPESEQREKGQRNHRRTLSSDQLLTKTSDRSTLAKLPGPGRAIGDFFKNHSRRASQIISGSAPTSPSDPRHTFDALSSTQPRSTKPESSPGSSSNTPVTSSSSASVDPAKDLLVTRADDADKNKPKNDGKQPSRTVSPELSSPSTEEAAGSDPDEVNDAGFDSDDHEDDEDVENPVILESPTEQGIVIARPILGERRPSKPHSHMKEADAESIIGGTKSREVVVPDIITTLPRHSADLKTFSFSLPFSNPLANIEFPNFKFPSIFNINSAIPPLIAPDEYERLQEEFHDRIDRQLSITSNHEDSVFSAVRALDNSRMRAVRRALTPNISIDLLNPLAPPKLDLFPEVEGDVVILGGYRGSILRDRVSGRRVWIPIKAGFNLRKIDLTIGPKDEDEYNMHHSIYPDGMLTHIGPVDVSRKLIKKLRANPKCKVYEFGYDWRLSSDINSARLCKFLESLPSNKEFNAHGKRRKGAIVIAHSMGGLIAHHAMQQNPTIFRGLLYAGVPSSCPNILGPLRHGDSVLLSSKILTKQVNFLMRSSYVFLPTNGRCFVNKKDTRIKYDLDFFDVNTWIKYELSPLVVKDYFSRRTSGSDSFTVLDMRDSLNNFKREHLKSFSFAAPDAKEETTKSFTLPDQKPIEYDEAVEYLERTLKRTKKFLEELDYDTSKAELYPPLASLYGYTIPTLRGAKVDSIDTIRTDSYEDLLFGAGDGVVYHKWTMPEPKGFELVAKVGTDRGHVGLLNDVEGVGRALAAILATERTSLSNSSKSVTPPIIEPAVVTQPVEKMVAIH